MIYFLNVISRVCVCEEGLVKLISAWRAAFPSKGFGMGRCLRNASGKGDPRLWSQFRGFQG